MEASVELETSFSITITSPVTKMCWRVCLSVLDTQMKHLLSHTKQGRKVLSEYSCILPKLLVITFEFSHSTIYIFDFLLHSPQSRRLDWICS